MPYVVKPFVIASWISLVRSLSPMHSRTRAVDTSTSSAGTRPLPSARGTRRCEITALRMLASWIRTCFCW